MNIDIIIFIAFLALNLVVGLRYGRGIKTIKDYALGDRNFSTGAIVATIVATWMSGNSFFINLSRTYSDGLYYVLTSFGVTTSFLITAFIFVPKMSAFLGKVSIAELMGDIYGKQVQVIVAIAGIIGASGGIAVQFKAFGNVFDYFLGVPGIWAMIVAGGIVTIYSAFGGIRAVTFTDVLQFFVFGFAIPLVGILIWNQVSTPELNINLSKTLQEPKFNIAHVLDFGNPKFWEIIPLLLYFSIPKITPVSFQRISIGKNIEQVKKAFVISAVILLFIDFAISWIPFLIYTINPNLESGQLLGFIINNYTYPGLKGLMMIGIAAMAMSTADSYINASSVLFANDICNPLKIGIDKELYISKIFSFILGISGIYFAMTAQDLLSIILAANAFYVPIVTVPATLTILDFRSSTKSVLIGMAAGFITVVVWKMIGFKADVIVFAMLINLIFLMGSHYLLKQPGGWVKNEDKSKSIKERLVDYINYLQEKAKNFNLLEFLKKYSPKSELTYMSFGIYCIFYTLTTIYSTQNKLFGSDSKVLLYIYQIMLCTSVVMAMYPIWPPRIKHEIIVQTAWNFVVFYMLVFFSGFLVLISGFSQLQFVVFTLNMVIVAMLTSWRQALLMMVPGFYMSVRFYKYYVGLHDGLDVQLGSAQYILMYTLVLIGSAFVVFFRPKEYEQALAQEKIENLNIHIQHREQEFKKFDKVRKSLVSTINARLSEKTSTIKEASKMLIYHLSEDTDIKLDSGFQNSLISAIHETSMNLWSPTPNNINTSVNINNIINEALSIKANSISDKSLKIETELNDNSPEVLTDELCAKLLLIGFLSYIIEGLPSGENRLIKITSSLITKADEEEKENKVDKVDKIDGKIKKRVKSKVEDGINHKVQIEANEAKKKEFVSITFTDNGFGISTTDRQNLDDKFNANDPLDYFNPPLDNLLQIVNMLSCECSIEPVITKGTTITLNIPLSIADTVDKDKDVDRSKARVIPFKAV